MADKAKSKSLEIEPIRYQGSVADFRAWMDGFLARAGVGLIPPSIPWKEIYKRAFEEQKSGDVIDFTRYYSRLIVRYSEVDRSSAREVWYVAKFDPMADGQSKPPKRSATILAVETFGITTVEFLDGIYFRLREPNGRVTDYARAEFIGDDFSNYAKFIRDEWGKNIQHVEKVPDDVVLGQKQKRIEELQSQVSLLQGVLTSFSQGLDKVSKVQFNQTKAIEGLIEANETQGKQIMKIQLLEGKLHELEGLKKHVLNEAGIFISYSHADKDIVDELSHRFEKEGIKHWFDDKDMLVGQTIDKTISQAIQKNWLFLVVLSPKSIKSKWVEREFDEASYEEVEGKKVILPVVVKGLKDRDIPPRVRRKLYVDLTDDFEAGYKKLKKSIFSYMAEHKTQKGKK